MALKTSDLIVFESRCQTSDVVAGLRRVLGKVPDHAEEFLSELEAACLEAELDFAVLASHGANECNYFRDARFQQRRDAFGIGKTGPGVEGAAFDSYKDAARFAVAEYLLKLRRRLGVFVDERDSYPEKYDRVRRLTMQDNWPNVARISDLNTPFGDGDFVWMEDSRGPEAIVAKGNALLPNLADQKGETLPMPTDIDVDIDLVNRGNAALINADATITVHNTGSSSPRQGERTFVAGGGGDQGVAYHFATDETGITQILTLWKQGIHAGNVTGNRTSIAIEMCMNRDPWDKVKEHTAQTLAMLHTRDPRLDWSGAEGFRFSLDRVVEHRDWAGANQNCPQRLIQTDGGVEKIVARAREIVAGTKPDPIPKPMPHPVGGEADSTGKTFKDDNGIEWVWVKKRFFMDVPLQAYEYANTASRKGPLYKPGKRITIFYIVAGQGPDGEPELFGTTRQGWRVPMSEVI